MKLFRSKKVFLVVLSSLISLAAVFFFSSFITEETPPQKLSEYPFFEEILSGRKQSNLFSYELNTPLFSDYANKDRMIWIPGEEKIHYTDSGIFDLPEGTVLIKTFYYPQDFRKPEKDVKKVETRLLVKKEGIWKAWPYIWDEQQKDATLKIAGGTFDLNWKDKSGKKTGTRYVVPNINQCKGCHSQNGELLPIGISARHLNDLWSDENRLYKMQEVGMIDGLPVSEAEIFTNVRASDKSQTIELRARAWLDINCAHCHSPKGTANTSGLFLSSYVSDRSQLGVNKTPVAAGRASGNLKFDIVPGNPEQSIMYHRLKSTDPGIRMPEIGRTMVDKEGLELISKWIESLQ